MKKLLILTVAVATCFILGCKSGGSNDYFPLTAGSQWNYKATDIQNSTTTITDTLATSNITYSAQTKTNLSNGEEVIPFQTTIIAHILKPIERFDTIISTVYLRESGDVILSYNSISDSTPDTALVTTFVEGKTWHNGSGVTDLVVGQEDITVPASTYKNTWKVKETASNGDKFFWYAKGTGLVKMHYEFTIGSNTEIFNQELTSSTIK